MPLSRFFASPNHRRAFTVACGVRPTDAYNMCRAQLPPNGADR